jgi:hypothetical protein
MEQPVDTEHREAFIREMNKLHKLMPKKTWQIAFYKFKEIIYIPKNAALYDNVKNYKIVYSNPITKINYYIYGNSRYSVIWAMLESGIMRLRESLLKLIDELKLTKPIDEIIEEVMLMLYKGYHPTPLSFIKLEND